MVQHEMYLGLHPTLHSTLAAITRLRPEDIQSLARELFLSQPLALSAVGPIGSGRIPPLSLTGR
jgi:predicted Zn-dependent peptidase